MANLRHAFVNPKSDGADTTKVRPSEWNAKLQFTDGSGAPSGTDASVRELLTSNRTYYVRPDGSDSNTGLVNSAGGAFLTLQHAWDVAVTLDMGGFSATIQMVAGTYTGGLSILSAPVGGAIFIVGDTVTPSNVVISTTGASCIYNAAPCSIGVSGLKLQTATSGSGLESAFTGAEIYTAGLMVFGACATAHLHAHNGGTLTLQSFNYTINGNALWHMISQTNGFINHGFNTITLSGTPAFSQQFAEADNQGIVISLSATFSGAATGTRYLAVSAGIISTSGGGANYFPGNVAGTADAATFGLYS